jgi:indole-3-glycerol phosphate synthase
VRNATALPVLRKDFLYEAYQVAESRALGADCILIIMAAVDQKTARELYAAAVHWNMDALVEVHDEPELERAVKLGARLIGINNRDLRTFATTIETTELLAPKVPKDRLLVGESGIFTAADVTRLAAAGVNAVLVGESLMRQNDVMAATAALLGRGKKAKSA